MTGPATWALLALVPVLVWAVALGVSRVRRLDRLHVRIDAAWVGLEEALVHRAEVAQVVAGGARVDVAPRLLSSHPADEVRCPSTGCEVGRGDAALRRAVHVARGAGTSDREAAENALGRLLAALDRGALPGPLREELAEAEQVLALARRMYNDAVRDTLGLRSRRMVRWLHLAGTARLPAYFEIADPATGSGVTTAAPLRPARAAGGPTG